MEPAPRRPRLSPAAEEVLQRARQLGLELFAHELGLEHVFCALLADESNAACQALLARFADPASLAEEALATADGIMVVGTHCALPFSTRGVEALFQARAQAAQAGESEITPARLALACLGHSPREFQARLELLGLGEAQLRALLPSPGAPLSWATEESLFRRFSPSGKKLLAVAAKACHRARERSISPQRVLLAALEIDPELASLASSFVSGLRQVAEAPAADLTPPPERALDADADLTLLLAGLPEGAGTLALLRGFCGPADSTVSRLLARQRVSAESMEAAAELFSDPDPG